MPFRYRLEKILNFRIRKKDEQLEKVRKAQMEVARVEGMIRANIEQIHKTRDGMKLADAMMLQHYDNFLQNLYQKDLDLKERKKAAIRYLQEQIELLQEREKEVKVLEKHKEKKLEEYKEEEKKLELKQLNETGSLRHFARTKEEQQEELEELIKLGIDPNEQSGF
jgi:flagellar export protein FliJ